MPTITPSAIDKDLAKLDMIRIDATFLHVSTNDTNWMVERLFIYGRELKKCLTKQEENCG